MTIAGIHDDARGDAMTIDDDDARQCRPSRCSTMTFVVTLDYNNAMMLDNARQRSRSFLSNSRSFYCEGFADTIRFYADKRWEPPLEDEPGFTPMLTFIVQGGGGVGARFDPVTRALSRGSGAPQRVMALA
eukprot:3640850-Rhodomonas_salina.1